MGRPQPGHPNGFFYSNLKPSEIRRLIERGDVLHYGRFVPDIEEVKTEDVGGLEPVVIASNP
jgi:hypothetical protein